MAKPRIDISPEQIASARDMRASGVSWANIGLRIGVHENTIRERIDPVFAAAKRFRYAGPHSLLRNGQQRISKAEQERALGSIAADTRTRHARLMGDPPPGRSALDRKLAAGDSPVKSVRAERGYYLRGFLG
jgi:hypothetical protein